MGLPSSSEIQPGSRSEPTLRASENLLPAICDVAASKRSGADVLVRILGGVAPFRAERGENAPAGGGGAHAYHVVLGGVHGEVADRAEVRAIVHGYDAEADVSRLLDGDVHGAPAEHYAKPLVGVDDGSAARLALDAPVGLRVDLPAGVLGDIGAEHVRDSVCLDTAQVRHSEHFRGFLRIGLGVAHLLEDRLNHFLQGLDGDAHFVFLGYFESFEHFLTSY